MRRFGKPSGPLLRHKKDFLTENDTLAARAKELCGLYADQPRRERCKICSTPLGEIAFSKLGIDYISCHHCGHLNGAHEDTDAFCHAVYTQDDGEAYGQVYETSDRKMYENRVRDIYTPKASFLIDALCHVGETPEELGYADLGAGSGYFVAALACEGLRRVSGYEASAHQVAFARAMNGDLDLIHHGLEETISIAESVESDVVSMIGVLEHLQFPRETLAALSANPRVRYIYLSVPLYSPCVFLEIAFPDVFPRQLSGGHTHLFTERSIDWICEDFGIERVAEWWFGTDMVDFFRNIHVTLEAKKVPVETREHWSNFLLPALDAMQHALDEQQSSSEVHMLLRKCE